MILTAGYLPGLSPDEVEWQTLTFNRGGEQTGVAVPLLSDHQIKELSSNIKKASRHYLKALPVSEILRTIDKAIGQFLDRSDPYRQQAEKPILPTHGLAMTIGMALSAKRLRMNWKI